MTPSHNGAVPVGGTSRPDPAILRAVAARVLWLATAIVDVANHARPGAGGLKVGGHQASSASMVDIMVSLWFHELTAHDRVSVKPHASPVLHAINYLLGELDEEHLRSLRALGGLQSYPSRTKDPDTVDFSTGSVGIGATATLWATLARRYLDSHFDSPRVTRRFVSLLGDAELDEGAVWEALVDPMVGGLGELLWIVDVNRQSLDRVIPDIQIDRLRGMFSAAGWEVITLKWGHRIQEVFERPGGADLRQRLETMPNEEYQRLLRSAPDQVAQRLPGDHASPALRHLVDSLGPKALGELIRDLGGHDMSLLLDTYQAASSQRPTVIFAYTIKGHGLPTEGHPGNHSALLTGDQMRELAKRCGTDPSAPWELFPADSDEAELCRRRGAALRRQESPPGPGRCVVTVPDELGRPHRRPTSTQAALGRLLSDLARDQPELASRVVTCSPDVASSTNLGGWINKCGVWSPADRRDWFADDVERLLKWQELSQGRHIELGIAEVNLVCLLGELGATWSRWGERLIPIGTLYDPFVTRALEPWSYGMYAGGQSILVGTPSGITLAPEGGAHQSITTPVIGIAQPGCVAWEPASAQDLEWTFLHAMSQVGLAGGTSAYFRLSTRPIDPVIAAVPEDPLLRERRRRQVVRGGYRLSGRPATSDEVTLVGVGAILPEVVAAAATLREKGFDAGVVCLTSPDLAFRCLQRRAHRQATGGPDLLEELFPCRHPAPLVTVVDGHPHTLSFLAGVRGDPIRCLGVEEFGQSSDLADAHRLHGIDASSIVEAALGLLGR
ncbi:pyruvate dehydrogenase [Micromonospora sp. NPDC048830]|uniref:transketolase-like TK C-terminal-containing protein n=1 Tax=Micromonospora sp. NPDC048830 TaxID=3364257 RepID=UPI003714113E